MSLLLAQQMSWLQTDTTYVLAADTTDVLSADTTDVLAADTTDVLSADTSLQSSAMAPWSGGSFREDFARKNAKMRFSPRGSV